MLFGSGEMSAAGRRIHEAVLKEAGVAPPVKIGILETPTGFEVNAIHGWPERMQAFFERGLRNFKPVVSRIRAWRRDGPLSTDDPSIVDAILGQDYLYCGAGSPSYVIRHLSGTRALQNLMTAQRKGATLCLGSATAVAAGRFAIPVYEIFKAGADLHWLDGLDLFAEYGFSPVVVPHWNNREGEDFDTTRCWMGKERFERLRAMLPLDAVVLGIDENTACVVDLAAKAVSVLGKGRVYVVVGGQERGYPPGDSFSLDIFRSKS